MTRRKPFEPRFWSYVEKTDTCWLWRGTMGGDGYGRTWTGTRNTVAHRAAYELLVGPIPEGLHLDHLCRVRNCVNPGHLEPVTPGENVMRGMAPCVILHREGVCKRGHKLVGGNVYSRPATPQRRQCRACRKDRDQAKAKGPLAPKTECVRGHAYDETNTGSRPAGGRYCKACLRENGRRYYAERRAAS